MATLTQLKDARNAGLLAGITATGTGTQVTLTVTDGAISAVTLSE